MIFVSEEAAASDPALNRFLTGAGLSLTADAAAARRRVLAASEAPAARPGDVLLDFADGPPSLVAEPNGPARLRFGFPDMAFGHALLAELIRPSDRPACGEPESARLLALAERIASSDATVLVLGETGTGKEGLAHFIHAASPRADESF